MQTKYAGLLRRLYRQPAAPRTTLSPSDDLHSIFETYSPAAPGLLLPRNFALKNSYPDGLRNAYRLNAAMGDPAQNFAIVHIAGTNGKGSVAWKLASALQAAGLTTGLFTSPHIASFRERVRINGEVVSEALVEKFLPQVRR
jgi:folylpolyglutamate synthase/dihydropteroate synthase